ncbi:putative porin [Microbulbifer taiwanensis]|uniref:putative porin n=1 Tax=Microbulbifer taiwanensis TaxID=986746 RepID=UPI003614538C
MKFKFAALPLMVFAASAAAEEYTSISEANYTNTEYASTDTDRFDIGTTYFFAPKESLGPLKEFEYINKVTNIGAGYSYLDFDGGDADTLNVRGEYFTASGFVFGASYSDTSFDSDFQSGDSDSHTLSAGYLFNPDFLAQVHRVKGDDSDAVYFADLRYNHRLSGNDYIGFNFVADDEFDSRTLSSKLFKDLGETYLTANATYVSNDDADNYWSVGAEYYFSKETSVFADYDEVETFELGVSHFFNRNVAGKLAYTTNNDTDVDAFLLGVTVQL